MLTRIALLEDHLLVRRALKALLEHGHERHVVIEASTVRALLTSDVDYDLLICDLSLPGPSGLGAIGEVRRRWPRRRILVLTMYDEPFRAAEAIAAGADGYALKLDDAPQLEEALREVVAGNRWLSPALDHGAVDRLLERRGGRAVAAGPLAPLSPREREVFDLLVRGHSCAEVGAMLFISPRTADTHRSHIFDKLGVHSVAELTRFAARFGLIGGSVETCATTNATESPTRVTA
jgi:DNA-binding NarL/FixJ family response regulator